GGLDGLVRHIDPHLRRRLRLRLDLVAPLSGIAVVTGKPRAGERRRTVEIRRSSSHRQRHPETEKGRTRKLHELFSFVSDGNAEVTEFSHTGVKRLLNRTSGSAPAPDNLY